MEIREILVGTNAPAIQACTGSQRPPAFRYSWVSGIERGAFGTCYYSSQSLFRQPSDDQWTFAPPSGQEYLVTQILRIAIQQQGCPPYGDGRYVVANEVSEGLFVRLAEFWMQIVSSEEAFDKATAPLSYLRQDQKFQSFRDFLTRQSSAPHRPVLRQIELHSPNDGLPYYALTTDGWSLLVDLADDGIIVIGFGVRSD